jgi:hypothetical protein
MHLEMIPAETLHKEEEEEKVDDVGRRMTRSSTPTSCAFGLSTTSRAFCLLFQLETHSSLGEMSFTTPSDGPAVSISFCRGSNSTWPS